METIYYPNNKQYSQETGYILLSDKTDLKQRIFPETKRVHMEKDTYHMKKTDMLYNEQENHKIYETKANKNERTETINNYS